MNNATLTGESVPEPREAGPSDEEDLVRSPNVVLAGTFLTSGRLRALVFATAMQTEFGHIAHLTQATRAELSPLQREIVRLGRIVAVLATVLGGVFFLIGRALGLPPWENLLFAIGIIVANVPEGLLPTVTLALAMASQRMARRNVVVRDLVSVETLGSATVIRTDKTGTLTENRMEARALFVANGRHAASHPELAASSPRLFAGSRLCHTLQEVRRDGAPVLAGDPMEVALGHLRAMAACLGAIVVMQVCNVLLCRTERAPTFSVRLKDNPLLFVGVAVELLLIGFILYTPWGNHVFATAPVPATAWLFVLPFAAGMLALEEARKAWVRRVRPQGVDTRSRHS
ncbi:HAD-IC family P-type ATPase [Corallococcus exercitus]|uniref:HAD-IC family P-type ATPase n=1 Tax=Corallococcus exercitus TaxID=2316736 RepID=UPI001C10F875